MSSVSPNNSLDRSAGYASDVGCLHLRSLHGLTIDRVDVSAVLVISLFTSIFCYFQVFFLGLFVCFGRCFFYGGKVLFEIYDSLGHMFVLFVAVCSVKSNK